MKNTYIHLSDLNIREMYANTTDKHTIKIMFDHAFTSRMLRYINNLDIITIRVLK